MILLAFLFVPPLAGAAAALAMPRHIRQASWFNALTLPISLASASTIALALSRGGPVWAFGGLWRFDALSALMALLVSIVATLAAWVGPGLQRRGADTPADQARAADEARTFRIYANLFAATMLLAVSTSNLGIMWVAVEATTVTSALLIPLRRTKTAVEASWKYLLIGSVGIALAFTGTVLAYVDYASTGGSVNTALEWTTMLAAAHALHPEVARLAFVFLLVGFGTKAGLVPMHTWLPDAHSEAPASLSAMMSGVLLAVALYALARWKVIIDTAVGAGFADTLVLAIALATILIGTISLVAQTHYKRLLAYSSIEHTGLACFGLALGPLGVFAALLHLTCHALAKSTVFLVSGRVLDRYHAYEIAHTPGLLTSVPATGGLWAAGILALIGLPPFGLFVSEVLLIRAGWSSGHVALTIIVLVLMLVAFASLLNHLQRMLFGSVPTSVRTGEPLTWSLVLLAAPMILLIWVGTAIPLPLQLLLARAAQVLQP
jgi:hydrogenase-4 component F